MNKLVSVIVPAYNQAKYLAVALDSVLAQTHTDWECIIINDGSTDDTERIARAYAEKDARFKYFQKENGGLSSARNAGLKKAAGNWIQFLDSDDYIVPKKFELSFELFNKKPAVQVIVSDFKMFIDKPADATAAFCALDQSFLNFESILMKWDVEFNIPIHCGLFKCELFAEKRFNEDLKANEDWVMWLDIFRLPVQAFFLNYPLAYYRNNPNSMTKDKNFVMNCRIDAYKFILLKLAGKNTAEFACAIIERLHDIITNNEQDLSRFRVKSFYKIETSIKKNIRKLVPLKKKKL